MNKYSKLIASASMVVAVAFLLLCSVTCFFAASAVQAEAASGKTAINIKVSNVPEHGVCVIGTDYQPEISVTDNVGNAVTDAPIAISSADETVLSVSGTKLVPKTCGEVEVTFALGESDKYESNRDIVKTFFVSNGKVDISGYDAYSTTEPTETSDGTCRIFSADENAIDSNGLLAIPETLTNNDGKKYRVTGMLGEDGSTFCPKSVVSLSVPSGVTAIASYSFAQFSSLKSVTFSESGMLETIGNSAFRYCKSIETLTIPASVKRIENGAFNGCSSLTTLVVNPGGELDCSNAYGFLSNYSPFGDCSALVNITLGEGVKNISGAFASCYSNDGKGNISGIKSIEIPASVENIEYAFYRCAALESVKFASGSKITKASNAFYGCSALTSIDISMLAELQDMGRMLYGCSMLETIVAPDSPYFTMALAENCSKLSTIKVSADSKNLTQTAEGAILKADNSKMLYYPASASVDCVLPEGCIEVSAFAFEGNAKLKSVTFTSGCADGVIGEGAFRNCTALASVVFAGDSFGSIGKEAFAGCTALESIEIPGLTQQSARTDYYTDRGSEQVYTSGYIVSKDSPRDTVETAAIGANAFKGCTSLKSVRFGSATDLGCYAIVSDGSDIFCGCTALVNLVFDGKQPYWMNEDASVGARAQGSGFYVYARYIDYFLETGSNDSSKDAHSGMKRPDFSYGVYYYLTKDDAQSDDAAKSKSLACIEYKRGTDTSAIATGDKEALKENVYNAQDVSKIPDPNAVAKENGMSGDDWVWVFEDYYDDYGDLYDSCYVYLAHANDLSLGHVESAQTSAMREPIVSNISSSFDIARWFGENKYNEPYTTCSIKGYNFDGYKYSYCFSENAYNEDSVRERFEGTCYFTWGADGIIEDISVKSADGTKLVEGEDYSVSYQKPSYDSATGKITYSKVEKCIEAGPYVMTVTALQGGKCTTGTSYSQWILVKPHSSTVSVYDQRTDSATGVEGTFSTAITPYADLHKNRDHSKLKYGTAYTVTVAENDAFSALLGAEIAGLSKAEIKYSKVDLVNGGFTVAVSNSTKKWTSNGLTAVEMANWVYSNLNEKKTTYGFSANENPWGDTAFLCSASEANVLSPLAVYSYQMNAPIFLASNATEIDETTLANLKNFKNIVVFGNESVVSADAVKQVEDAGTAVTRVSYNSGDICGVSLAATDYAIAHGIDASVCAVCDGQDRLETIAATDYAGFVGGITLSAASTADAKRVLAWMYANRDLLSEVRVFGREDGTFANYDIASMIMPNGWVGEEGTGHWDGTDSIWSDGIAGKVAERVAVGEGDTVACNGMLLAIQADGSLEYGGTSYYSAETLVKGQVVDYMVPKVDVSGATASESAVAGALSKVPSGYLADASIQLSTGSIDMKAGDIQNIAFTCTGNAAVSAKSSDENIAKASLEDGKVKVRATGFGEAAIELSAPANDLYKAVSTKLAVYVSKGSLDNATVSEIPVQTYTSSSITPSVTVTLNGEQLEQGKDFTVSYSDNVNAGTAKVTVTGTGGFIGSKEVTFAIEKASQDVVCASAAKTKTFKAAKKGKFKKKLKKNTSISAAAMKKLFGITANGSLSFAKASVTGKAKKFVNISSAGKVIIKKGLKKGTYALKIKVSAAATANYKAASSKTVTLKIKVK